MEEDNGTSGHLAISENGRSVISGRPSRRGPRSACVNVVPRTDRLLSTAFFPENVFQAHATYKTMLPLTQGYTMKAA